MPRFVPATLLVAACGIPSSLAAELIESEALPGASVPAGTTLKIEADHEKQQLTSPTALTFDEKGRILITETHRFAEGIEDDRAHLYWYLDDLASKTVADRRALHEKWKEKLPLEKMTAKSELVRRLSDSNGDGTLDDSRVFEDGFNDVLDGTAAGIFAHDGSVYLACIPKLLMLRDGDDDGKADERKTIEEGFGVRVSLSGHDLNGFALGPDGRIYGTIGDRGMNLTTKEGVRIELPNQGAAFRFEPDGTGFELFHTGLRNPKEIAFDEWGNPVTVDNNSDQKDKARIVYLAEGGDSGWEMEHQAMFSFHREIGLPELPPSRWMDEKIWHLQNDDQPAFIIPPVAHLTSGPSGLTYHPGAGFLESENGRFLICDYRGSAATSGIWSFAVKPDGAGMKLADARKFLTGVAATDVEYSWDGRLFVTDFVGGWKSHENGRLLSLDAGSGAWRAAEAKDTAAIIREGFEKRGSAELANLLRHPDARVRLRAQIALTRKDDALKRFTDATVSSDLMVRVHGIWGLGILARRGSSPLAVSDFAPVPSVERRRDAEKKLWELIKDPNEEIRVQALRALCDATKDSGPPPPLSTQLADKSPRVRYFASILIGKRKLIGYYGPVCDMIASNNNRDPLLRHAGAFALERMAPDSNILLALKTHASPAVRLAAVVALRRMKHPDLSGFINDADPKVADEAIRAICDLDLKSPRGLVAALLDHPGSRNWSPLMMRRLLHNSFRLGDEENASRVIKYAADPSNPEELRKEAFRLLIEWPKPFPVNQFTGHWAPLPDRDVKPIGLLVAKVIPDLLKQRGFALGAALDLLERYKEQTPKLSDKELRDMVEDSGLPENARSKALDLIVTRNPADLAEFLTKIISEAPEPVAITALKQLARTSPASLVPAASAALESGKPKLAKNCWTLLAPIQGAETDATFVKRLDQLRATKGVAPDAIELLDAARTRKSKPVEDALAAFEQSIKQNPDPLVEWNIALEGGDPETGHELFVSHPAAECMRCHRVGEDHDVGGETAPNLTGVAARRKDRRYFIESLIQPSAVIAPGFGAVSIGFKNGASAGGNLLAETTDHLDLEYKGKPVRVKRADIATLSEPASAMPPMTGLLKPAEVRDLVAWLASLTEETKPTTPAAEPEPFDPATLVKSGETSGAPESEITKLGRTQYLICGACHGQQGEGTAIAPPLASSEWINGPAENLIRIQLRGLNGPITVKGKTHEFPAGMTPLAYQSDEQIADVLSYVRSSFGNNAPKVSPDEVAKLRGEVGKPPLTQADLIPPHPAKSTSSGVPAQTQPATSDVGRYDNLKTESNLPKWIAASIIALILVGLTLKFRGSRE